jgi:hypothetical protein
MKRHAIRGAIALACLLVTLAGALAQVTGAQITTQANTAFRDYVTDGISASGAWNPRKSDIRALFGAVGSAISTAQGPVDAARLPFETLPSSTATDKVVSPAWVLSWAPSIIVSTPTAGSLSFQPSTTAALSNGVVAVTVTANGSGGTNGTFDLAFSGGGGSGAAGRFTVASGAVVPSSIVIRSTGSGYTSAPTVSFAASSGLTGATATATTAVNCPVDCYFAVPGATADVLYSLFRNNAGSALALGTAPSTAALSALSDRTSEFADTAGIRQTLWRVTEGSGSISPSLFQSESWTSGVAYEVFADVAPGQRIVNLFSGGGLVCDATFDLSSDVATGTCSPSIERIGGDMRRLWIRGTAAATTTSNLQFRLLNASLLSSYTGDGASGVFVARIEARQQTTFTNIITSSRDFSVAAWSKQGLSVSQVTREKTGAGAIATTVQAQLDGVATQRIVEDAGSNLTPRFWRGIAWTSGQSYTAEWIIKASGRSRASIFSNGGAFFNAICNLETGIATGTGASIENLGGGWFACRQTIAATASVTANLQFQILPASGAQPYAGDGTSGLLVYRMSLKGAGGAELLLSNLDVSAAFWTRQHITVTANQGRYIPLQAALQANTPAPTVVVPLALKWTALGSSITAQGFYTGPLAERTGWILTNAGVSGASCGQASNGHSGSLGIFNAIASIPTDSQVVTLECGTNDNGAAAVPLGALGDTTTATFYGAVYASIVAIQTRAPSAKIILLTPYSGGTSPGGGTSTHRHGVTNTAGHNLGQYQRAVVEVGRLLSVPVIDVGQESGIGLLTSGVFTSDGLHINSVGGAKYATFANDNIQQIFRRAAGFN